YINSPFYGEIMRGILQGLSGTGYLPIFADGNWRASKEERIIQMLLSRRIDGLIVMGGTENEEFLRQIGQDVSLIIIGRTISGLTDRCLNVVNDFEGAYKATQYLIELGHRDIVHITGILSHQDAEARRTGYLQSLIDAGIEPNPALIIEGDFSERAGVMAVEMLLTRGRTFSAIFAANDQMAYGARLALFRHGLRVPDDVSMIGFDDQPGAAYMTPPLTTIRHPATEMGEIAAQAILSLVRGETFVAPQFSADLIIRESVTRHR
ncbi:MAG: substrate-binding domain-containing protein, partial [Chloroflexota bacterium]